MSLRRDRLRILSIDGGGIRGIIPGQVLIGVEKMIQEATGRPEARLADFFDLIAGTSTGGILSCLYLIPEDVDAAECRPKYSAAQAVDLYLERGDEIFDVSLWQRLRSGFNLTDEKYSAEALEEALEDFMGDTRLSQLLKPCLITAYDIRRRKAHFFNQADALTYGDSADFYVRDVARSTSAAPTYFESHRAKSMDHIVYPLVDGGLFANNPTLCAYAEARSMPVPKVDGTTMPKAWTAKDMCILSLGTGSIKAPYVHSDARNWGLAQWVKPVIDIQMSGGAETVDYQLRMIYDAVGAPEQYLRIETELPSYIDARMDCATTENMGFLRDLGADLAAKFREPLERFIGQAL